MRLENIPWVVVEPIYEEMKELREAHDSWVSFEEALREAYGVTKNQRDEVRMSSTNGCHQ